MSVKRFSAQRREGRWSSFGKTEQPAGTLTVSGAARRSTRHLPQLSQYSRADDAPVPGSQYSMRLSSSSSRASTFSGRRRSRSRPRTSRRPRRRGPRASRPARSRASGAGWPARRSSRSPLAAAPERDKGLALPVGKGPEGGRVRRRQRRDQVDPRDVARVLAADAGADAGSPVAALRAVAPVAEPGHQLRPGGGDPLDAPTRPRGLPAETVARQRRAHHVERVGRGAAMGDRVGQRPDHLQELHHRARPAVRHDQRQRALMGRAYVDEADRQPVDLGAEVAQCVEPRLGHAPVVAVRPVARTSSCR